MFERYAAFDFGDCRTGIALGDSETGIATPLTVIEKSPEQGLIAAIVRLLREERLQAIIVGLPINMDGSEGPQAKKVRALGEALHQAMVDAGHVSVRLVFHDERLTSAQADWEMAQSGLTHQQKKARRDAIAAAAVLRDWMATQRDQQNVRDERNY